MKTHYKELLALVLALILCLSTSFLISFFNINNMIAYFIGGVVSIITVYIL